MATDPAASAASVLGRAALLTGILAVIAGFLGMHILAGLHGMHSQAVRPDPAQTSAATAAAPHDTPANQAHSGHSPATETAAATPVTATSVTIGGTTMPASCTCQGGCAEKPALHLDCTPSGSTATLSAPPPGTTVVLTQPWATAVAALRAPSAHIPDSPTPNDLSISRT